MSKVILSFPLIRTVKGFDFSNIGSIFLNFENQVDEKKIGNLAWKTRQDWR